MKKQILKSNSAFVSIGDPDALVSRTRTNLLSYSNDFSNAIWNPVTSAPTRTKNQIDPFGISNNAWTFSDSDLGNDASAIEQAIYITASSTTNYTFSIFAKQGTASYFDIYSFFLGGSTKGSYVRYVWATDTFDGGGAEVNGAVPTNLKKVFLGNGWYRFSFGIKDSNDGTNTALNFRIYPAGRDAGKIGTVVFYGAQIEISNFQTNYINNISSVSSITEYVDKARLYSLVQNSNFSINNNRQSLKMIGSQSYSTNHLLRNPSVDLSFNYYLSTFLNNELLMGFQGSGVNDVLALNDLKNKKNNFYIMINPRNAQDGFYEPKKSNFNDIDFSGYNVLSFGDCHLKNYSVDFRIGEVPVVSASYSSSNMKFESLNQNTFTIPSINPKFNGSVVTGICDLSQSYIDLVSGYINGNLESRTEYNPSVVSTNHSSFSLQDLQVGGIPLSTGSLPILQGLNISIDFNRTDLYGLGSNHVLDRKLQYPINAQVNIDALVSGFNSGIVSGMTYSETGYNFDIAFSDTKKYSTGIFKFKDAKLNSFNYGMDINNNMAFNASFSIEITDSTGFMMSRKIS